MSPRRTDRLRPASVVSHLGVMVAVAAVMGVLVAGLALPFAAVTGLSTRTVADGMDKLPASSTAEPLAQRTRILGRDGAVLATLYDQNRVNVPLAKVAPMMRKAIIAIEDYRFYQHGALDLRGTLRAFVTNQASGGTHPGWLVDHPADGQDDAGQPGQDRGRAARPPPPTPTSARSRSCATRSPSSRTTPRTGSSSATSTSPTSVTAPTASRPPPRHYFSKPASELNLREAALLAGLVKNPTGYDPTNYPGRAKERRNIVLAPDGPAQRHLRRRGRSRPRQPASGLNVEPRRNGCVSSAAPFFCDYAIQYLLADQDLGKTVEDRAPAALQRRPDHQDHRRPALPAGRRRRGRAATSTRPTRPSAAWRWSQPGTGEVRALAQSRPMGGDKKKGADLPQLRRPQASTATPTASRPARRSRSFVLAAGDQPGHPAVHHDQLAADRLASRSNRYRDLPRAPARAPTSGTRRTPPGAGTLRPLHRHPAVGEHLLRPARAAHRPVRAGRAGPARWASTVPEPATSSARSPSASPTPTR